MLEAVSILFILKRISILFLQGLCPCKNKKDCNFILAGAESPARIKRIAILFLQGQSPRKNKSSQSLLP